MVKGTAACGSAMARKEAEGHRGRAARRRGREEGRMEGVVEDAAIVDDEA